MKEKILDIKQSFLSKLESINDLNSLNDLRVEYLGKKSPLTDLLSQMVSLSIEEKKEVGFLLNNFKNDANNLIDK